MYYPEPTLRSFPRPGKYYSIRMIAYLRLHLKSKLQLKDWQKNLSGGSQIEEDGFQSNNYWLMLAALGLGKACDECAWKKADKRNAITRASNLMKDI